MCFSLCVWSPIRLLITFGAYCILCLPNLSDLTMHFCCACQEHFYDPVSRSGFLVSYIRQCWSHCPDIGSPKAQKRHRGYVHCTSEMTAGVFTSETNSTSVPSTAITVSWQYLLTFLMLTIGLDLHYAKGFWQMAIVYWAVLTSLKLEAGVNKPTDKHSVPISALTMLARCQE